MMLGRALRRPAAAEVRLMLANIKRDNMERGRMIAATRATAPSADAQFNYQPPKTQSIVAHNIEEMGSFTSMPKVIPSADAEDRDLDYPEAGSSNEQVLEWCDLNLQGQPAPLERSWVTKDQGECEGEKVRVLQWNVLSQALGTKNDNFVRCPEAALEWRTRRFRMLEEIVRHEPDVICLQEVDRFPFLKKSLSALGFQGHFFPKPDSPCLYLQDNSGPDGCAIFYRADKFELSKVRNRVIEVWHVESNQVVMCATLRSKETKEEFCVATTHLKARNGALLSTLRNEQGKDLVDFLAAEAADGRRSSILGVTQTNNGRVGRKHRPVIVCGDFNAEPTEPVYSTMTENELGLDSAYANEKGEEPAFTTWKIREDGEHIQTLDYMFHSKDSISVSATLEFPSEADIGADRVPSYAYASDHFSLVADFVLKK